MKFELWNEHTFYSRVNEAKIYAAMADLESGYCRVLVLESTPSLAGSSYIQAMKEKDSYTVEIRFENGDESFKQLQRKMVDVEELTNLFQAYANGIPPNIEGWKDITELVAWYFDDAETGVTRETSHPYFRQAFLADIYYDISQEEAPFGNDTGADTLAFLEELIEADELEDLDAYPKELIEENWEMDFFPASENLSEEIKQTYKTEIYQSYQVIIATGFSSIKITGEISEELKQETVLALQKLADMTNKSIYEQQATAMEKFSLNS
ncbi:hypothetical protein [Listeria sp. ILCC792]|uniref:hypothetical protein n=1 Tax=Listeria sp. ILCC792 TaxID=1918331 RepID=UPI000B58DD64|nr:hypothetical protein [Listeria sp. ILCC792]